MKGVGFWLKINRFGPITDATVKFAPMLIFTGESSLGKSYVNYLIYYFIRTLFDFDISKVFPSSFESFNSKVIIKTRDIVEYFNAGVQVFMRQFLNDPELICDVEYFLGDGISPTYEIVYKELRHNDIISEDRQFDLIPASISINNSKPYRIRYPKKFNSTSFVISRFLSKHLFEDILGTNIRQCMILPPARGAFVGENFTIKDRIGSSVGMYKLFLQDYDMSTALTNLDPDESPYKSAVEKLINGKIITENDIQYVVLSSGRKLPLSAAASSIKEISPLLIALQSAGRGWTMSICFEEPEAHLHPSMQVSLMDLLATCFNNGMLFQLTTHSDYIIQRLNQLIKLNYLRQKNQEEYINVCEKHHLNDSNCLKKEDIIVYYFSKSPKKTGAVSIKRLDVEDSGFPMVSFFETVEQLTRTEDDLDNAIEKNS